MTAPDLDALIAALTNPSGSGPAWNLCGKARTALVQLRERIADLEAERADLIKINNGWAGEWDAMREERDALQKNCTALVQMFELASAIPQMSDEQLRELVANSKAAIDAAKEKP